MSNTSMMISVLRYHLRVALLILARVCPLQQNRGTGFPCPYYWIDETGLVATVKGDEQPQNEDKQVDVG